MAKSFIWLEMYELEAWMAAFSVSSSPADSRAGQPDIFSVFFFVFNFATTNFYKFHMATNNEEYSKTFMHACEHGYVRLVARVLSLNPLLLVYKDCIRQTGLIVACVAGQLPVVKILVEHPLFQGMAFHKTQNGTTPFLAACSNNRVEVARYLVRKCDVNVNETNYWLMNGLHLACQHKCFQMVVFLTTETDIRTNTLTGGTDKTILMSAIRSPQIQRYLLSDVGVDPNQKNKASETALMNAAMWKDMSMMCMLVEEFRADVSVRDKEGRMALDWSSDMAVKRYLLDNVCPVASRAVPIWKGA